MTPGTILYDKQFQFSDTQAVIDKLLVVLCEIGHDYLVVLTTSNPKFKSSTPGCNIMDKLPNFYVPVGTSWFTKPTWILLNEVYDTSHHILNQKIADGTITLFPNVLSSSVMKDLLDCALESIDIDGYYLDLIAQARQSL